MAHSRQHEDASSVGRVLESGQVYNLEHPLYKAFVSQVEHSLTQISQREALRRSTAKPLLFTSALDVADKGELMELYPEFDLRVAPMSARVHTMWSAHRACANELLAHLTAPYAQKVVHFGGSFLSKIVSGERGHHVEHDITDSVSLNETHEAVVDAYRAFGDIVRFQADYGVLLRMQEYSDHLAGRAYGSCNEPATCTHRAEALCIDMSLKLLSPQQVAVAMMNHGATMATGCYIYNPEMLVRDDGLLTTDGVAFRKTERKVEFLYPQGRAGAATYDKRVWAEWLASHTFRVGAASADAWFQLELLQNRGPFMFFRMVRVPAPVGPVRLTHALDLPDTAGYTLVNSWKMKNGLKSDPSRDSDWEKDSFVVLTKVEQKVMDFAMQLTPELFSRFALKKQIRVVNNRWIICGVMVSKSPALHPLLVEKLTTALFARAFAKRYESSQLSAEMMDALRRLFNVRDSTLAGRLSILLRVCASWVHGVTLGKFENTMHSLLLSCQRMLGLVSERNGVPNMVPPPTYVKLTSEANSWRSKFKLAAEKLYAPPTEYGTNFFVARGGMGEALATAVARYSSSPREATAPASMDLVHVVRVATEVVDTRVALEDAMSSSLVEAIAELNPMDQATSSRHHMEMQTVVTEAQVICDAFRHTPNPDPVHALNEMYGAIFPKVAQAPLEFDTYSLSLDPQDRVMAAPYLRMPTYFGNPPVPRKAYRSKLNALNVPKRQNTGPETLTAINARNANAPQLSIAQKDIKVHEVWEVFLRDACRDEAKVMLANYQSDPVALEEDALKDWISKATPEVVERVVNELKRMPQSLEEMDVGQYDVMLKSDVKPTVSVKPDTEMTVPQVIVYHKKPLSAMYSSMYRVLVRRFQSILKPNYYVNLLKDNKAIGSFITEIHDHEGKWKYLENDFSKYDKSQGQFAFDLEFLVFQQLGLNQDMLDRWHLGHVECSLRSVATGLSMHLLYQRKSGDATTAFGNVILNVLSVTYAYAGTDVKWAVFMGDDSIVCAGKVTASDTTIRVMAEVFNLTAKFYITDAPYFASSFIVLDGQRALMVPDPVKRVEKLSMHVAADDPQWRERHISFKDSMETYKDPAVAQHMSRLVPQRYEVPEGFVRDAASAFGTLSHSFSAFRGLWEADPEIIQA